MKKSFPAAGCDMAKKYRAKRAGKLSPLGAALAVIAALALLAAAGWLIFRYAGLSGRYAYPVKYRREIMEASAENSLPPCLVASVVNTESGFDPNAVSPVGAVGLMQLLPSTAEWIAGMRGMEFEEQRLYEPAYNIDMGCWLLSYMLKRYDGNLRYALIAYNAGHGALEKWLADPAYVDENGELAVIPYNETRNYVDKIEKAIIQYEKLYGEQLEKADD